MQLHRLRIEKQRAGDTESLGFKFPDSNQPQAWLVGSSPEEQRSLKPET